MLHLILLKFIWLTHVSSVCEGIIQLDMKWHRIQIRLQCKNDPYYTITEVVTRGVHYLIAKIAAEEQKKASELFSVTDS